MKSFKIDKSLKKTISLSSGTHKVDCILYVSDFDYAYKTLKYFPVEIEGEFPFINALLVKTSVEALDALSSENFVQYISSQANVEALMNVSRKILNVNENSYKNNKVAIAYIDTGIMPHLDFMLGENRIVKFIDLINYKLFPYDDNGHGTFVAGVGSGSGIVSFGKFKGIAPNSDIISIKALDKNGEANASKILDAMQWVYDNAEKYSIRVVCMSFGSEPLGYNDPIMKGAEALWQKGISVVSAAGNSGPNFETIKSPGISPKIITVGGLNDNRFDNDFKESFFEIAKFSSRGPAFNRFKPDVIAPSVDITSCGIKDFYTNLSGTSVATPMIAGLCCLAYQKNKYLHPDYIKRALFKCCKPVTFNRNLEGYGIPNAKSFLSLFKEN